MSATIMPKLKNSGLKQFRNDLYELLKKRSRFVDSRAYRYYKLQILGDGDKKRGAGKKKLDEIYTTLKNVKYLDNKVINKKTFSSILEEAKTVSQEYKVTIYCIFKQINPRTKADKLNKVPVSYKILPAEAIETFSVTGKDKIKKLVKQKIQQFREEYEGNEEDVYSNVVKPIYDFKHEVSSVYKKDIPLSKIPMKSAFTLTRDWLKYAEGIDKKAYEDMGGMCVYELLINHLKDYWKTITKEKLFEVFNEYVMNQNNRNYLDDIPFQNNFNLQSGVNTDMIKYLCEKKKISLYAFDNKENCFEKCVYSRDSNYRPIAYYCIDGHMYLINDAITMKQLSSAQKANKNNVVSSMLEMEKKTIGDERAYVECATFTDALAYENSVVYLPQGEMTNDVHHYIEQYKSLPKLKVSNHSIVEMEIEKKNLTIICDPNVTDGYTWKDMKAICDKVGIPFKNQKIGGLIAGLRKKFFKPERRVLTDDEKASLVSSQENKCNECEKDYTYFEFDIGKKNSSQPEIKKGLSFFEFDHIIPLACGGSNDMDNFQALCKGCHLEKTMAERENSDFIKFDDIASTFNDEALNIVKSRSYKQWAFIEKLKLTKTKEEVHKLDHVKCRRNLVMHSKYDFPMYSVMDYPQPYDGRDIECGEYFVKPHLMPNNMFDDGTMFFNLFSDYQKETYFPFRGNGWYSHAMVKRCIELGVIKKYCITHMFIPSFTIKNNHFQKFADFLVDVGKVGLYDDGTMFYNLFNQVDISKLIVNSLVGTWGIQRSEFESIHMTLDKHEASRELVRDGVQVLSNKLDNDTTIYSIIERMVINKDDMYLPLYNQIIAMEAMELYELEQMIKDKGGVPLERNTDAILYAGKKIDIDGYFWDAENTVNKYRYDDVTYLNRDAVCKFVRTDIFKPAEFKWTEYEEKSMNHMFDDGTMFHNVFLLNDDFKEMAQKIYDSGIGCQILGVSGAGKTSMANELINIIEASGKKCIKLAPTRKAASHIKGKTIHKYYLELFLSNNYEKKILKSLNYIDYMIVDEISMVKEVFYRFLVLLKRYQPKLKFIIIGDYDQLKPVKDAYQGEYRNSPALHQLCDGMKINLEKCRRSDEDLFNLYDKVRRGGDIDSSKFPVQELTKLNIAYSHKTRKYVNKMCMEKFGNDKEYLLSKPSNRNHKSQLTKVYEGLPIVSFRNDNDLEIYNSEVFTVHKIDTKTKQFFIMKDEVELAFDIKAFKFRFYPAYCVTVHVSQGCTYDQPFTIYDWSHPCMDNSAKYVALSRSTNIHYIQIKN